MRSVLLKTFVPQHMMFSGPSAIVIGPRNRRAAAQLAGARRPELAAKIMAPEPPTSLAAIWHTPSTRQAKTPWPCATPRLASFTTDEAVR
jgi:hypothetical protein